MERINTMTTVLAQAETISELNDAAIEALAQMLYDIDSDKAMDLMRYIGIMDMEASLEQREGVVV
jgi:hypothetical protein